MPQAIWVGMGGAIMMFTGAPMRGPLGPLRPHWAGPWAPPANGRWRKLNSVRGVAERMKLVANT